MNTQVTSRKVIVALYVNAAMLALVAIALFSRDRSWPQILPAAFAQQAPQPIAGGGGLFLMPAQFSSNVWGCYVMDVDRQTLCAYEYRPGEKLLRLIAARGFTHDRQLNNFNTDPDPLQVKDMVERELQKNRAVGDPN